MSYTVERIRTTPAGNVTFQLVRSDLSRVSVTIARKYATDDWIDRVLGHALDTLVSPAKAL